MVCKIGDELQLAGSGSVTNGYNACLDFWNWSVTPTVYHQNDLSGVTCHRKLPMLVATVELVLASLPDRRCVRGISFFSASFLIALLLFITASENTRVNQEVYSEKKQSPAQHGLYHCASWCSFIYRIASERSTYMILSQRSHTNHTSSDPDSGLLPSPS
jgi:hypothetical protein